MTDEPLPVQRFMASLAALDDVFYELNWIEGTAVLGRMQALLDEFREAMAQGAWERCRQEEGYRLMESIERTKESIERTRAALSFEKDLATLEDAETVTVQDVVGGDERTHGS